MNISKIRLISVIVPTRGRSHKLTNLIDALDHQERSSQTEFEVILVIDGEGESPEGSCSFPLKIIQTDHIGAGPARNLGITHASGDAVVFLNDDVVPDPGFIDAHVQALNAGHRAVLGDSPWMVSQEPSAFDGFIAHSPAIFSSHSLIDGDCYDFRYGWTLNLSVRRDVIDNLNHAFDPELRPIYFEDIEFAYRCFGTDSELFYCPSARAPHDHRVTAGEYFAREVLLGIMSVVLDELNPDCHDEIFALKARVHASIATQTLDIDVRDQCRILDRFIALGAEPACSRDPIEQAMTLYDLHLPLKRRAFRIGLCAMCLHPIPWDLRIEHAGALLSADAVFRSLFS